MASNTTNSDENENTKLDFLPDTSASLVSQTLVSSLSPLEDNLPVIKNLKHLDFSDDMARENQELQQKLIERNKLLSEALNVEIEAQQLRLNEVNYLQEINDIKELNQNLTFQLQKQKMDFENSKSESQKSFTFSLNSIRQQVQHLSSQLTESEKNLDSLNKENLILKTRVEYLQDELKSSTAKISDQNKFLENEKLRLKQELEQEKVQFSTEFNQKVESLAAEYNSQISRLENEIHMREEKYQAELENSKILESQLQEAELKKDKFKDAMLAMNLTNNRLSEEINEHLSQINDFQIKLKNLNPERENYKAELNKRIKVNQQLYREKQDLLEKNKDLIETISKIDQELVKYRQSESYLNKDLQRTNEQLQTKEIRLIEEMQLRVIAETKIKDIQHRQLEYDAKLQTFQAEKQEWANQINELQQKNSNTGMQIHFLKKQEHELQNQIANIKMQLSESQQHWNLQTASYQKEISALTKECQENENSTKKMQQDLLVLQNDKTNLDYLLQAQKRESEALSRSNSEIQAQLELAITNVNQSELQLGDLIKINEALQQKVIELQNNQYQGQILFENEKNQIEKWLTQLNNREHQMRQYIQHLESKREEIVSRSKQFVVELNAAVHLHPLKDLIKFTDHQIEQLSEKLQRLPLLSTDRPDIESQLDHLSEQQNFLKSMTNSSKQHIERQCQEFMRIMQIEPLMPLPPMPKKTIKIVGPASEA